jgi:hypothetical protein
MSTESRRRMSTESSLLLYLETCAVDHAGAVVAMRMNAEELALARRWAAEGFIEFGRIRSDSIKPGGPHNPAPTMWVHLSDEAMEEAHAFRAARARRLWINRHYARTVDR